MRAEPNKLFEESLKRLRVFLDGLPESAEVEAWGHPTFRAGKKMFAALGSGSYGEGVSIGFNMGHDRQEELLRDERFFPTPYAAHQGWVSLRIDRRTNWDEVRSLFREGYRQVALKRMLKSMDEEK